MMNPAILFLFIFVAAPLIELYVLIEVGSEIGALSTILVSVITAVLGGALVRIQGLSVLFRVRETMERGEAPAIEMMEGAILLLAGLLLLLPGFITDALGFLALLPPLRRAFILLMLRRSGTIHAAYTEKGPAGRTARPRIIEGEYRRDDD